MKGDGWAVKRYVCPNCKRKGLYIVTGEGKPFMCMYKNCTDRHSTYSETIEVNPILLTEKAKWKP